MFKNTMFAILASASLVSFADTNASAPVSQQSTTQTGDNQKGTITPNKTADSKYINSPTVNSRAASSQLFPQQDELTGTKGTKYNTKHHKKNTSQGKTFDTNKADDSNQVNSPNVSSLAYSGSQFPQQNKVTGTKGAKYNSSSAKKQPSTYERNNPTVSSLAYSGAQFPQQNQTTGNKHINTSAAQ